jgi:hypothetical protein
MEIILNFELERSDLTVFSGFTPEYGQTIKGLQRSRDRIKSRYNSEKQR